MKRKKEHRGGKKLEVLGKEKKNILTQKEVFTNHKAISDNISTNSPKCVDR